MNNKINFDIRLFICLFGVSIVINYFLPSIFSYLWFFGILFTFLFSKNQSNYFWIVLFWLMFSSPGYLFLRYGSHPLPVVSVPGLGRDVYYEELFAIFVVIKAFWNPIKQTVFYRKQLLVLVYYALFLLLMGLLSGTGILTILKSVRYFIPILLLLVIPRLIPYNDIPQIIRLMFISSFLLLSAQLFDIIFGYPVSVLFGETQLLVSGRNVGLDFSVFDVTRGAVRTIYGPFMLLFSLILSIVLLIEKKSAYKSYFLYLIAIVSALSIFLSATRGWIIAVMLVLLGLGYIQAKRFRTVLMAGFLIILVAFSIPKLSMQILHSFDRVLTLKSLTKGDLTAAGSLSRITTRSPKVMNKFWEQPVLGFGFSDEYYDYADGHVGNQTLLLNGGIVGYLVFLFFVMFMINRYYHAYIKKKNKAMLVFILGLMALIIVHSTSRMVFGYSMNANTALSLSIFFFFSDYYIKQTDDPPQKYLNENSQPPDRL